MSVRQAISLALAVCKRSHRLIAKETARVFWLFYFAVEFFTQLQLRILNNVSCKTQSN
jgi:hypothetical protein